MRRDGLADIVGRRWGASARLPWNAAKSWPGSAAMFLGAQGFEERSVNLKPKTTKNPTATPASSSGRVYISFAVWGWAPMKGALQT